MMSGKIRTVESRQWNHLKALRPAPDVPFSGRCDRLWNAIRWLKWSVETHALTVRTYYRMDRHNRGIMSATAKTAGRLARVLYRRITAGHTRRDVILDSTALRVGGPDTTPLIPSAH